LAGFHAGGQQSAFRTEIMRDDVKSLEIRLGGEMISSPFMELDSDEKIEIAFDAMHRTSERFAYSVIHCNADWTKSELISLEYMRGFQNEAVEDIANSFNTTARYTNHILTLPNENVRFLVSGNYAVQVFEEYAPDNIIFTACFSVVEPLVEIEASVKTNTDIDFNMGSQQVEFSVIQQNVNIAFPHTDLKTLVYQNNNRNDVRYGIKPLIIRGKQIVYQHNGNLIFDAGNEYRRIEFLTHRYNGMGVESIAFYNPYYNVTLIQDKKRDRKPYLYDQDQNGRFFVGCSSCKNPATEADYYIVHFSLASEFMDDGNVYLFGDMFNNIIDEKSLMEYNAENGAYEKAVMLKQGLYNYMYAFVENGDTKITFDRTEGNFSETENEYTVAVYYRPMGARYDRLIGVKNIGGNRY
jgi:hypothetical protein